MNDVGYSVRAGLTLGVRPDIAFPARWDRLCLINLSPIIEIIFADATPCGGDVVDVTAEAALVRP